MIFQTEGAIDKILRGEKTQTRRLWKANYHAWVEYNPTGNMISAGMQNGIQIPEYAEDYSQIHFIFSDRDGRDIYKVGKDYAVQPARAKPAVWWRQFSDILQTTIDERCPQTVRDYSNSMKRHDGWQPLRIRILELWREDVRKISNEDGIQEGYTCFADFMKTWCKMHDPLMLTKIYSSLSQESFQVYSEDRPAERYDAVAIRFEVVK